MKNDLICGNCKTENPFYQLTCFGCKSYLRARIVNIDFWDTLWKYLYSPVSTARNIIQSENKNFVLTSALIAAFKFSIISFMLMNAFARDENKSFTLLDGFISGGIPFIIIVTIFAFLVTLLNKAFGIRGRVKDAISIYFYSFVPLMMVLFILTPIQFALFGEYWFTFNPSPFIVKPQAAIVIFIIELFMYLWSGLLFITSTYALTKNLIYSVSVGLFGFSLLSALIFYLSAVIN